MDEFMYVVYKQAIDDIDLSVYCKLTRPQVWWDIKGLILSTKLNSHIYTNKQLSLLKELEELVDAKLGL